MYMYSCTLCDILIHCKWNTNWNRNANHESLLFGKYKHVTNYKLRNIFSRKSYKMLHSGRKQFNAKMFHAILFLVKFKRAEIWSSIMYCTDTVHVATHAQTVIYRILPFYVNKLYTWKRDKAENYYKTIYYTTVSLRNSSYITVG